METTKTDQVTEEVTKNPAKKKSTYKKKSKAAPKESTKRPVTAYGIAMQDGNWVVVQYTINEFNEVINREVSDQNIRAMALERFRIDVAKTLFVATRDEVGEL